MKLIANTLAAFALSAGMGMADSSNQDSSNPDSEAVKTKIIVPEIAKPIYATQDCILQAIENTTGKKPNLILKDEDIISISLDDHYPDGGKRSVRVDLKQNQVQELFTMSTSFPDIAVPKSVSESRFFSAASTYYGEINGEVINLIKGTPDRDTALDLLKQIDANLRACAPSLS